MPEALTPLERRVYQYMIDFLAENTYQPSIREIAKRFRIKSTKTVSDLLHALTAKGYIERDQSRSRGVRILGFAGAGQVQPVPVSDDGGQLASEGQRYITVDRRFLPSEDTFFLRAPDDGLAGRSITAGDYLLVSPAARAKDGDVVAVRHRDRTLVRMLTHRGMTLVLESANDSVPSLELGPRDEFRILGVVAGVFRPFFEQVSEPAAEEAGTDLAAMAAMADVLPPARPTAIS